MLKRILILLVTINGIVAFGQNIDRLYKDAMSMFLVEDLISARGIFNEIIAMDPSYKDAKYRLEICELLTNERNRSIDDFLAYAPSSGRKDKFYNYWLGNIYVDKYEFRNAINAWKRFLDNESYKSTEILQETNRYIKEAEELIRVFENPGEYEIHRLPINSEFDEISPVFFEDKRELLFASSRYSENQSNPSFTYKVYHTTQTGEQKSGTWSPPVVLDNLGSFMEGEANLELIDQDNKLFQFRAEKGGDLYYSDPTESGWTDPQEFDNSITKAHINAHFFINEHEDRVIFASDEYFKKEGLELYQSYKDHNTDKWNKPTLISPSISTRFNEDTPYLSLDEKSIYFSSNRPGGLGGYDIYVSQLNEETHRWEEPVNLGFPINSPDNDLHFKMNPDQKSGYFSSDRYRSSGEYDIYFYWEIEKVDIKGRIFDLATKTPATDAVITFKTKSYEDEYFRSEADSDGRYIAKIVSDETFIVEIERNGAIVYSDTYDSHPTEGITTTYHQDFYVGVGEAVQFVEYQGPNEINIEVQDLGSKFRTGKTAVTRNVYFDHGTSQLKKSSNQMLQVLLKTMQKSPKLRIEVAGHTDNTGPADVNEWLSQRRAESIQKW